MSRCLFLVISWAAIASRIQIANFSSVQHPPEYYFPQAHTDPEDIQYYDYDATTLARKKIDRSKNSPIARYYKLHQDRKNWSDARKTCAQEGAHLVVINSQEEADQLRTLVGNKGIDYPFYWVGFKAQDGKFVTISRKSVESLGYTKWGTGEPSSRQDGICGVYGNFDDENPSAFNLGVANCTINLPYICELITRQKYPTVPKGYTVGNSNSGYTRFGNSVYKLFTKLSTWYQARNTCILDGAHLAIINSKEKEDFVISLIMNSGGYSSNWIGVNDINKEGDFVTIFNQPLESTGYVHWNTGDPNGKTEANCVHFYYGSSSYYGLRDDACTDKFRFICEKEIQ